MAMRRTITVCKKSTRSIEATTATTELEQRRYDHVKLKTILRPARRVPLKSYRGIRSTARFKIKRTTFYWGKVAPITPSPVLLSGSTELALRVITLQVEALGLLCQYCASARAQALQNVSLRAGNAV